jgi:25S rRNA (uracil2634-N3)-methyltransferase
LLDELRLASKIVAGRPAYESALASQRLKGGSLRQLLQGKNVMLVGEGDFSFALSLASALPRPARLLASGLDDETSMLQKYPQWASTAAALQPLAMVSHGVDATLLGESESFRDILKSSTVVLDIIGWQFPHGPKEASRNELLTQPAIC